MKLNFVFFMSMAIVLIACHKKNDSPQTVDYVNNYPRPWNTKFISFSNATKCGSHSQGFTLFYKDTVIGGDCLQFDGVWIKDSVILNDSVMMLFQTTSAYSTTMYTQNGGYTWTSFLCGPTNLIKYHVLNTQLSYCFTTNKSKYYVSGVGKSNLVYYETNMTKGTYRINDFGTKFPDLDSTSVALNDSVTVVIKFK